MAAPCNTIFANLYKTVADCPPACNHHSAPARRKLVHEALRGTDATKKTTRFRQLIEAADILVQPCVYDGFSARLVQQMGFAAGSISGAGLSDSNLGWADVGLMGYAETLHA
jgi:hypothetical protein